MTETAKRLDPALRYVMKYAKTPTPSQTRKLDLNDSAWEAVDKGADLLVGSPESAIMDQVFVLDGTKMLYPTKRAWGGLKKKINAAIAERQARTGQSGLEWKEAWPTTPGFYWFYGRTSAEMASARPSLHVAELISGTEQRREKNDTGETVTVEIERLMMIVGGKAVHSELGTYGLFAEIYAPDEDDLPEHEFLQIKPPEIAEAVGPVVHHVRGGATSCGAPVPTNPALIARSGQLHRVTCATCRLQMMR